MPENDKQKLKNYQENIERLRNQNKFLYFFLHCMKMESRLALWRRMY